MTQPNLNEDNSQNTGTPMNQNKISNEAETLPKVLEAILFVAAKPLTAKDLAKILQLDQALISSALQLLFEQKKDAGITLLENNGEYQLATNSIYSAQIKNFLNAELREKLTDATIEVLAIISYRQPISKAEIEAIRGVNSQYSLRALLMRGLIEKVSNPHDARSLLYQTTTEFLMNLGLNSNKDLPEFQKLVENIKLPKTEILSETGLTTPPQPEQALEHEQPEQEIENFIAEPQNNPIEKTAETEDELEDEDSDNDEEEDEDDDEDDDEDEEN